MFKARKKLFLTQTVHVVSFFFFLSLKASSHDADLDSKSIGSASQYILCMKSILKVKYFCAVF